MKNRTEEAKMRFPLSHVKDQQVVCDGAYLQINKISFERNFRVLIGHYSDQSRQVSSSESSREPSNESTGDSSGEVIAESLQ